MNKKLHRDQPSKAIYGAVTIIRILAIIALVYFFIWSLQKAEKATINRDKVTKTK